MVVCWDPLHRITTKKHGYDAYAFFKRRKLINDDVHKLVREINGKTLKEAASILNGDVRTLLILLHYLRRVGVIREVRIR